MKRLINVIKDASYFVARDKHTVKFLHDIFYITKVGAFFPYLDVIIVTHFWKQANLPRMFTPGLVFCRYFDFYIKYTYVYLLMHSIMHSEQHIYF